MTPTTPFVLALIAAVAITIAIVGSSSSPQLASSQVSSRSSISCVNSALRQNVPIFRRLNARSRTHVRGVSKGEGKESFVSEQKDMDQYNLGRRLAMQGALLATFASSVATPAQAKKKIPLSDYSVTPSFEWRGEMHPGIRYYDLKAGSGKDVGSGDKLSVHYDCAYKSVIAVSTRQAVVLSQNRYIERPYGMTYGKVPDALKDPLEFEDASGVGVRVDPDPIYTRKLFVTKIYRNSAADEAGLSDFDEVISIDGEPVEGQSRKDVNKKLDGDDGSVKLVVERNAGRGEREQKEFTVSRKPYRKYIQKKVKSKTVQASGGLYSGEDLAPPPDVIFVPEALKGMKKGGLRRIEVPADLGFGPDGKNEIPGDEPFFVDIEIVSFNK
mmetsp:Transcript_18517/g.27733  ORF Transcript_18517/g.27733 Transcript_18517/m.27733 type:complete len:384 (-) Transcript_18517:187-1338(-)|eukprot:CAMPEP_0167753880 /NCGR_PEP_ID=MMETSP0110_2-20121227/7962_1 /TAXON_ID=629695 /ORGANISM="Gymnochlora sp., Strain CCMP2014" /LENGTH=383 /DNA_ID=CAMNT_0007639701 /DNA_START=44 /DNA_END=1195 /DNA_ORIENTATION=+